MLKKPNWIGNMKIKFVDIQNFRKLKLSRINLSAEETLLVGANNSGKTSAMDALINFLDHKRKLGSMDGDEKIKRRFSTTDFTLSNWKRLNDYAESWISEDPNKGESLPEWQILCPSIDIWLDSSLDEVHLLSHLIPTLKWEGGLLGIRLIYQPKNLEKLKEQFVEEFSLVEATLAHLNTESTIGESEKQKLKLWPRDMKDFLDRRLNSLFEVSAYILDPSKLDMPPQQLLQEHKPLEYYPFNGLFRVDVIEAQRGFFDPNSSQGTTKTSGSLSSQLNQYYTRHLDPTNQPGVKDLAALQAIDTAKTSFDERFNASFKDALGEICGLGYPGFK